MRVLLTLGLGSLLCGSLALLDGEARACGCFAPPDPTVGIAQAGESILFAVDNGVVTQHVQLRYQGDAKDFAWLLPLPSVPTLDVGTDELFTMLQQSTQPTYQLELSGDCGFGHGGSDGGAFASDLGMAAGGADAPSPLVGSGSVGPYDYAVLKADDQTAMTKWLADNHYFVPATTSNVIAHYIHPGGYFLALKLRSGQSAGDLQPVVVRYASDLPMIPLTLTSVGATDHMPIWVWVLGAGRAIPRNYYDVVINDAQIDWLEGAYNYEQVVANAVAEAPNRHGFVTEYAGASDKVQGQLDPPGRFSDEAELAAIGDAVAYCAHLRNAGWPFTSAMIAVLQKHIAMPDGLTNFNGTAVTPGQYYFNLDVYVQQNPWLFSHGDGGASDGGVSLSFDPVATTAELDKVVAQPTLATGALLRRYNYVTRLHTAISPADMDSDPVFDFNTSLPNVGLDHLARGVRTCGGKWNDQLESLAVTTPEGFVYDATQTLPRMPFAERIQSLPITGGPQVIVDNTAAIVAALPGSPGPDGGAGNGIPNNGLTPARHVGCGCALGGENTGEATATLALVLVALAFAQRRRR